MAIPTPWGTFYAQTSTRGLRRLSFPGEGPSPHGQWDLAYLLVELLNRYFSGHKVDFSPIPLDLSGTTAFQVRIWEEIRRIPHGTTITYGQLATCLGIPRGARAVGQALKKNPIPIIIPCHRVVGQKGLTGFSGGLSWKRRLISLESGG